MNQLSSVAPTTLNTSLEKSNDDLTERLGMIDLETEDAEMDGGDEKNNKLIS